MVDLDHSTETWLLGVAAAFGALAVFNFVPIVGLIRLLPAFKEVLIGAGLVVLLLDTTELGTGAVYALVVGMAAAVVVNVVRFGLRLVGLSLMGAVGAGPGPGPGVGGGLGFATLGVLTSVVGLVLFSPVGYLAGGAAGAWLNENA
ncbi:MAG: hypothetical protein A07HB70_01064 [uncultured archaeon A07HB70]|nr:MAG: hypothetical protein A07HB70_01064 [uncultured archaeon A07HB70]